MADEVSDLIAREYILSDVVAPGELLPSEAKLAERYGVSRVTTRAGLRTLREAGLISIRHGVGSVVLPRSDVLRYGLDRLSSFETFAREAGRDIQTDSLAIEESVADEDMARALAIPVGAPIFVAPRTKIYKGTPVAWLVDHFPRDLLPREVMRAEFTGSVLDVLLAHDELHVDYAECEIEPVAFSEEIAARLGCRARHCRLVHGRVRLHGRGEAGRTLPWMAPARSLVPALLRPSPAPGRRLTCYARGTTAE